MSDLLSSVKNSFFHDVLGCRDAEARLEGREGAYLFRESDVKAGLFIITYVKNSSVSHLVTPNKNGKFIRQKLEDAVEIAADVIACSDSYRHPVPPPSPGDGSSQSSGYAGESRCYCCSFTSNNKRILEHHQRIHKVVKCQKCCKYFKASTFVTHKKHCNTTPEKLSCGVCEFESVYHANM